MEFKTKMKNEIEEIKQEINEMGYKLNLILGGIRNILEHNNQNGENDYLIMKIDRERGC